MLLAQLSDPHITAPGVLAYGHVDTSAYLRRAIHTLNALDPQPDAVIVTGDLVDRGGIDEYERLRALLDDVRAPCHLLIGNHDDRANFRSVFGPRAVLADDGFVHYAFDVNEVRIIALDTLDAGSSAGRLCAARLAWLEARLDEARDRPVLIAMHHPPIACGIGFMDAIRLAPGDGRALDTLIRRHPNVGRIVCGHVHRPVTAMFGGTIAWCSPSTAHQVALQLAPESADAIVLEPPAFGLHLWGAETGFVTHCVSIGQGSKPRSS
jgi:3',5'-cyclic-AMP phosphodiesterase